MHVNRPPGLPALDIVLPRPTLPTPCSFNSAAPSPRTPRTPSCGSSILFANTNRNSTDSWNSSNADEMDCEWKPDQVRLLSRTLDALPAHLVTPFNGPIPPSNLLDKIARGVIDAKGPLEWPHGIRATRVKLIELSRIRAKEEQAQHIITEVYSDMEMEDGDEGGNYACFPESRGKSFGIRRPLYRQSSMDFMNAADLKENDSISRLSDRLQRTDRLITNPTYHPYSRHTPRTFQRRLSSPARPGNVPSLINPSTPSSSTLNSLSSFSTHNRVLRHTPSNLSSTSASSISMVSSNGGGALPDPRVQRVRRADSFCGPAPPPKDIKVAPTLKESSSAAGIKRAPSFGALAQEVKRDRHHVFGGALKGPAGEGEKDLPAYPSSDEEEKIRSKGAKKMRVKDLGGHDLPVSSPPPTSLPTTRTKTKSTAPRADGKTKLASPKSPTPKPKSKSTTKDMLAEAENKNLLASPLTKSSSRVRPVAMNLQRNPSMFGAELPHARGCVSPQPGLDSPRSRARAVSPPACLAPSLPKAKLTINTNPVTPPDSPQKVKTLRRVRRLAPARRISFGSLVAPGEDADGEEEDEHVQRDRRRQRELGQLGSAFQLH